MQEIWKSVNGYEHLYEVSNLGRVRKLDGTLRTLREMKNGYLSVGLSHNGKMKNHKIHRLVAEAFIPKLPNKPLVNHIDGNRLNNNVSNLEWCDNSENIKHAYKLKKQDA